jgi:hypothetical protein
MSDPIKTSDAEGFAPSPVRHIPGLGCVCEAREASECGCEGVDWRSRREAELMSAIVAFCEGQKWADESWKSQPHIRPLFDLSNARDEGQTEGASHAN